MTLFARDPYGMFCLTGALLTDSYGLFLRLVGCSIFRYLGYSNEVGEAFRAWLFQGGVPLSYACVG